MTRLPLVVLAALVVSAPSSSAQELRFVQTTHTEMAGMMGRMMSMMGGMGDPRVDRTYVLGSKILNAADDRSSILDMASGDMIMLDHEARTFTRMNFGDMMARMRTDAGGVAAEMEREAGDRPEATLNARIDMDRTGRTETISGYEAEQVIMTLQFEPVEGEAAEGAPPTVQNLMAVVTEMWMSSEVPGAEAMKEWGRSMMGGMAGGMPDMSAMGAMPGVDPRMSEAMQRNAEELAEMDGMAIRTTVHMVMVPPDQELDVEAVLAGSDQPLSDGGDSPASAADAARQALGGLSGLLGGRGRNAEPDEAGEATMTQSVIMRTRTEITDVQTGGVDPSLFEIPEGYTERAMPGRR
ncbi:MAG: hypothetical protein RJQ04_19835 [Longimicrobiales bacterium]